MRYVQTAVSFIERPPPPHFISFEWYKFN